MIRTLLVDFFGFFETKKSTGSATNPPWIFGSAADSCGVHSRSLESVGRVHLADPPEVRADLRGSAAGLLRVCGGLESAYLIA